MIKEANDHPPHATRPLPFQSRPFRPQESRLDGNLPYYKPFTVIFKHLESRIVLACHDFCFRVLLIIMEKYLKAFVSYKNSLVLVIKLQVWF